MAWDMEPGDVLVFHPLIVHGSQGNSSTTTRRRALATRWFGDDVVYRDLPYTMPLPPGHGLEDGQPFGGPLFPSFGPIAAPGLDSTMAFSELPASAAWRHLDAREGFESVFFRADASPATTSPGTPRRSRTARRGWFATSCRSTSDGCTRTARVWGWSTAGEREVQIEGDGAGRWKVDGTAVPQLDGCLDVDLESSACTNMLPVRRLRMRVGHTYQAPAVYVRALDLTVERLEQDYTRVDADGPGEQYDYRSPAFNFACRLAYDATGLVLEYPGIATRTI